MTMYSSESSAALKLAGTNVDVSSSAMIAGPVISVPGASSKREKTGQLTISASPAS